MPSWHGLDIQTCGGTAERLPRLVSDSARLTIHDTHPGNWIEHLRNPLRARFRAPGWHSTNSDEPRCSRVSVGDEIGTSPGHSWVYRSISCGPRIVLSRLECDESS